MGRMIGRQAHHSSPLSSVCAVIAVSSTNTKREQVQAVREDRLLKRQLTVQLHPVHHLLEEPALPDHLVEEFDLVGDLALDAGRLVIHIRTKTEVLVGERDDRLSGNVEAVRRH